MRTSGTLEIDLTESELVINYLTIRDTRIIDFLRTVKPEEYELMITKALEIGFRVLIDQHTVDRVDYVDKEFQSFSNGIEQSITNFQKMIGDYFGAEGNLVQLFDEENPKSLPSKVVSAVMDQKSGLRALLDPQNTVSPFYKLREELIKQITDLRDVVAREKGKAEIYDKTSLKGTDFENELFVLLNQLCKHYGDNVTHVGGKATSTGQKVGDLVIGVADPLLGGEELIIVIEAKDKESVNIKELRKELGRAIENRNADLAIGIIKNRTAIPDYVGHFRFFEPNMIVCCGEDPLTIELAYRFGRSLALTRSLDFGSEKNIEVENVQSFAKFLENSFRKLETAGNELRKIKNSAQNIEESLSEYRKQVREELHELMRTIEIT